MPNRKWRAARRQWPAAQKGRAARRQSRPRPISRSNGSLSRRLNQPEIAASKFRAPHRSALAGGLMPNRTGISNRETVSEEAREREEHPPVDTNSPPPEDAAGRVGEQPLDDLHDRHTSHKAGSRS